MIDIDWDEAPEGTTHVIFNDNGINPFWRKVDEHGVHQFCRGDWDLSEDQPDWWFEHHGKHIIERPPKEPPPVESPLPNGLQWVEGALYYSPSYGGFFLNDERLTTNGGRSWNLIFGTGIKYWLDSPDTIRRYADGQAPQVRAEQPKPRKPVGWWS